MALRLTHNALDGELVDLIAAAREDLILAGVSPAKASDDDDPLIRRAITVYAKANFGFDNADYEKLQTSYNSIKARLSLSQDYGGGAL